MTRRRVRISAILAHLLAQAWPPLFDWNSLNPDLAEKIQVFEQNIDKYVFGDLTFRETRTGLYSKVLRVSPDRFSHGISVRMRNKGKMKIGPLPEFIESKNQIGPRVWNSLNPDLVEKSRCSNGKLKNVFLAT